MAWNGARSDAAWADPATHVVTLVAWGGVGKTSLVAKWVADLAARDHDGADYFDWSFYSQGTREEGGASADPFVDKALRFFGETDQSVNGDLVGARTVSPPRRQRRPRCVRVSAWRFPPRLQASPGSDLA